jgi:SAM-dependent methyltransferase
MNENKDYLESRRKKATKIVSVLSEFRKTKLDYCSELCLDLGCNLGIITAELSTMCKEVVGIDIPIETVKTAKDINRNKKKINFLVGDGLSLPFKSDTFDLVICAQVYEHTKSPYLLLQEIYRVMRPGGICFFSGPNRLWIYEYHYRWYFVHWLPKKILDKYCMRVYGEKFNLNLLNYWQLMKICDRFRIIDYSFYIAYELHDIFQEEKLRKLITALIPRKIAENFPFSVPNFNWILIKEK